MLVSSGAVGMGMQTMNLTKRPSKLSAIQALAAVGQCNLMALYEKECSKYNFHAAQMLLTNEDLNNRNRHLNVLNCINSLWNQGNLPIINENDSVSIDEIKLGDNDTLAAMLAIMTRSDLTILLTTVDGLHSVDNSGKLHKRIPLVSQITEKMKNSASGTDNSSLSIGGMTTKLNAAEMVTTAGEHMLIADGRDKNILSKIFNGEDVGTLFLPTTEKQMQSKKRWMNFFSKISGNIVIDDGAAEAIIKKGRSLLPSGIKDFQGNFDRGDTVTISDTHNKIIAKGLSSFSAGDLIKIAGKHSSDIREILGMDEEEAVHRNNMLKCNSYKISH
jgi:glutamate 5-kinase